MDRWLSYAEAADALAMTVEGVRQRARREGWRRTLGNDGRARVLLAADTAPRPPAGDRVVEPTTPDDGTDEAGGAPPGDRPDDRAVPEGVWRELIAGIEARAADLRTDLERERGERLAERDRADALAGQVADMARELARVAEAGSLRERELAREAAEAVARATTAEAMVAEYRARPWWRRIG